MNGNWLKVPNADFILLFFRILSLCHTAIPEQNEDTGTSNYEVESPNEDAFLVAAREFGFEFCKRTQSSIFVRERYTSFQDPVERILRMMDRVLRMEFKFITSTTLFIQFSCLLKI